MKKNNIKKIILNLLFVVSLCVFVYSGYRLVRIYYQNYQEKEEKTYLEQISRVPDNVTDDFEIDWKALKEQNEEIIGWIKVPNTNINYPIAKGSDNKFYLDHTFAKNYNYAGAIFMDYRMDENFTFKNTLIYGHNTIHRTMFSEIEKFMTQEFFDANKYLYIFTPEKDYRCEIFSIYKTRATSESYNLNYPSDDAWMDYVEMVKKLSYFDRTINFKPSDHIVSLSTCSLEEGYDSDLRILLHAKLVEWDRGKATQNKVDQNL